MRQIVLIYEVFHCMRSVLALSSIDFSKHSAVGAYFDIRSDSDYNDYFVISKKEVEEQISNAQYFYDRVEEYVVAKIKDGVNIC